ncbi:MAG: DUF2235 domain-containing protein [Mariprofundus sp.]|nr:DUF2235 domain-containing protein [Mariprofundus sp.]
MDVNIEVHMEEEYSNGDNQQQKPKNIILCADGTGNKGGYTPDSNVYKIYKAVEKEKGVAGIEQIVFYDNGVGTNSNKYLRALSGGLGFGFGRNVMDLYKFLARNYHPGDKVYMFGFSRGASTIRAFNGFIRTCGLIDGQARELSNQALDDKVKEAFEAYKKRDKKPDIAKAMRERNGMLKQHGVIPIHFTGIWDTVVALGWPKRTDLASPLSFVLSVLFSVLEKVSNVFFPHAFYNFKLTGNQINAYQALALDDERTAFWPFVWNENLSQAEESIVTNDDSTLIERSVEQVWFAGMHSNVGGGYNRSGLASVPLYWMMGKAQHCGLCFEGDTVEQARKDSHVHGRMYNSRDGAAIVYRYHPREIESLCMLREADQSMVERMIEFFFGIKKVDQSRFKDNKIRLYDSVISRMEHRTANYSPCLIPDKFLIVKDEIQDDLSVTTQSIEVSPHTQSGWKENKTNIGRMINIRKFMYDVMIAMILTVVYFAYGYWTCPPEYLGRSGFMGHVADLLDYILPDFFAGLIEVAVSQNPFLFLAFLSTVGLYVCIRSIIHNHMDTLCQLKRRKVNAWSEDRWGRHDDHATSSIEVDHE